MATAIDKYKLEYYTINDVTLYKDGNVFLDNRTKVLVTNKGGEVSKIV